jgi:hypothetical protein
MIFVSLLLGAGLVAAGLSLGHGAWVIDSQPSAARVLDLSLEVSKLLFLGGCLAVIAAGRWLPRARDPLHLALGLTWFTLVCGWQYTAGMAVVSLIVYALAGRLHPHLAMLLTAVLLLVGARFAFGNQPLKAGAAALSISLAALRLVYFAFELRAIRRSRRSLVSMLAYAPFSLLLWPGPMQLSYLTFTTARPQAELDRLGARQLLLGGAKLFACALAVRLTRLLLPDTSGFASLPFATQLLFVLLPYPLFFFTCR